MSVCLYVCMYVRMYVIIIIIVRFIIACDKQKYVKIHNMQLKDPMDANNVKLIGYLEVIQDFHNVNLVASGSMES